MQKSTIETGTIETGLFSRRTALVAAASLSFAALIASLFLRPLWRDEYWGVYFAGSHLPLAEAIRDRMTADVHPPLYFIVQHFWAQALDNDWWMRGLNIAFAATLGPVAWLQLGRHPQLRPWVSVLLITSYWFVFFGVELRMYFLVLMGSLVMTLAMLNSADRSFDRALRGPALGDLALFALGGFLASGSHVFGGLWTGCAGLTLGGLALSRRQFSAFIAWGVASAVAVAPLLGWVLVVRPDQNTGAPEAAAPFLQALNLGWGQWSRAVFVKTFGSNLPAFVLLALGARAALTGRRAVSAGEAILWVAAGLTTALSFAVQVFYLPLIKERAFIVIAPALVVLLAMATLQAQADGKGRWVWAVIIAALLSPALMGVEYFKDREEFGRISSLMRAPQCRGQTVAAWYRPSGQGATFNEFVTKRVYRDDLAAGELRIVDVAALIPALSEQIVNGPCPLKAIAVVLPHTDSSGKTREDDAHHPRMNEQLLAAGFPLDRLRRRDFAKGRTIAFVAPEPTQTPAK